MTLEHYPWTDRWLTGREYKAMIVNHEMYSQTFGLEVVDSHPASIYSNPGHGVVYFLRSQTLKDLGFPRVKGLRKSYKWKKMNFLTPLPKQNPLVQYLVATGRLASICYRMHVVSCTNDLPLLCQSQSCRWRAVRRCVRSSVRSLCRRWLDRYERRGGLRVR